MDSIKHNRAGKLAASMHRKASAKTEPIALAPTYTHADALLALGRCAQWLHHFAALDGCKPTGPAMSEVREACEIIESIGTEEARYWARLTRSNMERAKATGGKS